MDGRQLESSWNNQEKPESEDIGKEEPEKTIKTMEKCGIYDIWKWKMIEEKSLEI